MRVREGTSVNFGQNLHILGHNLRGRTEKYDLKALVGILTINLQILKRGQIFDFSKILN